MIVYRDTSIPYEMIYRFPSIVIHQHPHLAAEFNHHINGIIQEETESLKHFSAEHPPSKHLRDIGYYHIMDYSIEAYSDRGFSACLFMEGFSGGAHPYHYTKTLLFNTRSGKILTLEDMFVPRSNYLERISNFCIQELTRRLAKDLASTTDWIEEGAGTDESNYRNFYVRSDSLIVIFNEYQVAAYVAGPQEVAIPLNGLRDIIDTAGIVGLSAPYHFD